MAFGDIPTVFRGLKRARKRPYVFGPAYAAGVLFVLPILAGVIGGRAAGHVTSIAVFVCVVLYALAIQHPLVRYLPGARPNSSAHARVLRAITCRPLGMIFVATVGVAIWMAFWAVIFQDARMLDDLGDTAWFIGMFGAFVGISFWEIWYGQTARKERRRAERRKGRRAPV